MRRKTSAEGNRDLAPPFLAHSEQESEVKEEVRRFMTISFRAECRVGCEGWITNHQLITSPPEKAQTSSFLFSHVAPGQMC